MKGELQMNHEWIERLFPSLDQIFEVHSVFLRKLRERQKKDPVIESISDILLQQVFLSITLDLFFITFRR